MAQPDMAELKLMRSTKFPPTFTRKVDIRKVNMEVMKKWMAQRITELLGMEDDVTVDFAFELVNDKAGASFNPNIKLLQIKMQGFLGEKSSAEFCNELWDLMLSAQDSSLGVPSQLLEAKKAELIQERQAAEKRAQEEKRRRERDAARDREMDERRRRDRRDRNDRRDRDYYGGRGGRRQSPRPRSRSPRRRRDYDDDEEASSYRPRRRSRSRTPPRRKDRKRDDSPPPHRRRHSSSTPPPKRRRANSSSEDRDKPPPRRREKSTQSPPVESKTKRNTSSPESGD